MPEIHGPLAAAAGRLRLTGRVGEGLLESHQRLVWGKIKGQQGARGRASVVALACSA